MSNLDNALHEIPPGESITPEAVAIVLKAFEQDLLLCKNFADVKGLVAVTLQKHTLNPSSFDDNENEDKKIVIVPYDYIPLESDSTATVLKVKYFENISYYFM